jgi:tRNA(Arg) A34 adenosine deaminase TadA
MNSTIPFSIIKKLVDTAQCSTMNHRVSSCVLKKGFKITGKPCCNNKFPKYDKELYSSHAEIETIHKFISNIGLKFKEKNCDKLMCIDNKVKKVTSKYDIVVIRIDNTDMEKIKLVNGRPCHICLKIIKMYGFRKIYYSVDSGNIVSEFVKNMISLHTSIPSIKMFYKNNNAEYINDELYYDNILEKTLPNKMKKANFINFLEYDIKPILSQYKIIYKKIDGDKIVTFTNNNKIIKSIIID